MILLTTPFLGDFGFINSEEGVKKTIVKIASAIARKQLSRVDVRIVLSNGVGRTLVYYREDEKLSSFRKRILKEAQKHL